MRLRAEHPTDVVNRALAMEDIYHNCDIVDVRKINPKFVELAYDEEDKELLLLNLEYAFFKAPLAEVKFLIETLYINKKLADNVDEKMNNLTNAMKEDAIKQGIPEEDASQAIRDMIMKKE